MSSYKNFSQIGQKMAELNGQKTFALIWNYWYFRDFLAHNLAKYQYFLIQNQLYSFSTINIHIIYLFQLNISVNMDFMVK